MTHWRRRIFLEKALRVLPDDVVESGKLRKQLGRSIAIKMDGVLTANGI
jgi:hypothetical protein